MTGYSPNGNVIITQYSYVQYNQQVEQRTNRASANDEIPCQQFVVVARELGVMVHILWLGTHQYIVRGRFDSSSGRCLVDRACAVWG